MSETIGNDLLKKLTVLSKEIAKQNGLARGQQKELFAHMEFKLSGYLHGAETITEDDALTLVREHFGTPEHIGNLYREAEDMEIQISLWRKMAAVFMTTIPVVYGITILINAFSVLLFDSHDQISLLIMLPTLIPVVLLYFLLFSHLKRWKTELKEGAQPWFIKMRADKLALSALGLVILSSLVFYHGLRFQGTHLYLKVMYETLPPFTCLLWMYWFDSGAKRIKSLLSGALLWFFAEAFYHAFYSLTMFYIKFKTMPDQARPTLPDSFMSDALYHLIGLQNAMMARTIQYGLMAVLVYLVLAGLLELRNRQNARKITAAVK